MSKKITTDDVVKALDSLQADLTVENTEVSKASDGDLDQPEGADLGNPAKDKMSDEAKSKKKAEKAMGKGDLTITHEDESEDEDEEEGDDEGEDMKEKSKKTKKSMTDLPDEVQTKIEVSGFLKSLVDHNVGGLKQLAEFVAKSDAAHETRFVDLSEAVESLAKSQAKIGIVLKAICEKIGVLENSPAHAPKADTVVKSAERAFSSGLETDKEETTFKSLSSDPVLAKSQVSNALCELVMKGEAEAMDVISFESAGYIRPELVNKLKGKL